MSLKVAINGTRRIGIIIVAKDDTATEGSFKRLIEIDNDSA